MKNKKKENKMETFENKKLMNKSQLTKDFNCLLALLPKKMPPPIYKTSKEGNVNLLWESKNFFANFQLEGDGKYSYSVQSENRKFYAHYVDLASGIKREVLDKLMTASKGEK